MAAIDQHPIIFPVARAAETWKNRATDLACRALDILVAAILLVLLVPLMLIIGVIVRLDSPGPVLFRQQRMGKSLRGFTVHKFRTMKHGTSHDVHRTFVLGLIAGEQPQQTGAGPQFKLSSDRRVTRVGRALRRSSLDELPQLWDVLRGEMSLVGPRPALSYEVEHYPEDWFTRFAVKPGMTGLWQVSGRSAVTLPDMVKLDIEYVHKRTFWLNVAILLRTLPVVLSTRGAG
jgi:lipopolysaccharide/colanic/teichoic acid biosynthesis glycosyltransferase